MRGASTVALLLTPRMDPGVEEFVRVCVGILAGGGALAMLEVGAGRKLLSGADALPRDVERALEALAEFGVRPWAPPPHALQDLLRQSNCVLRVADPSRAGEPDVLVLDDAYLEVVAPGALVGALAQAGQVIRA